MLGNLIGGFIVILVGVTLAPTVANEVSTAQDNTNISGASNTIIGLTTLYLNELLVAIPGIIIWIEKNNARSATNPDAYLLA